MFVVNMNNVTTSRLQYLGVGKHVIGYYYNHICFVCCVDLIFQLAKLMVVILSLVKVEI